MAKIEFHKVKIELPETKKIDSIVGKKYLDNYQDRKQRASERMRKKGKTYIKTKDILIGETNKSD